MSKKGAKADHGTSSVTSPGEQPHNGDHWSRSGSREPLGMKGHSPLPVKGIP